MKYTGITWRPPFEANSLLLQVTVGCSHNKCTFCSMYRDVSFQVETMDQIEKDLLEARITYPHVTRVFLVNADPFCLSGNKLKKIANKVIQILPEVESIGMYASIQNIAGKSDQELEELSQLRINGLNVGVESGLPEVLTNLNKGFSLDDAKLQLKRLKNAEIDFSANIIIGAAGSDRYQENAIASANVINEVKPSLIFVATLHLEDKSQLRSDLIQGNFKENTLREAIQEELMFLKQLDLTNTHFFGLHPSNAVRLNGKLPVDKGLMIQRLEDGLKFIPSKQLDTSYTQLVLGQEGAIGFS